MLFSVVSLFPEIFSVITEYGVTGQAIKKRLIEVSCWNPRDFTKDRHKTVDDKPYGGGPGMLMKVEPLLDAIDAAKNSVKVKGFCDNAKTILLSPQGRKADQKYIENLASQKAVVLISGRYEGVDERIVETVIDEEVSVGDFVLSGGEIPSMLLIDAVARLVPGTLGHEDSACSDSFSGGLLDYPHYTRPHEYQGMQVPNVLLSGNHKEIAKWRLKQSLGKTWLKRPDLLKVRKQTNYEEQLLEEFISEYRESLNSC